jgi:predicted CxxxxCH...CXXCH cytochrome family protein
MKKPRLFNRLAKSKSAKLLASMAVFLLAFPPQVFPLAQIVNKYVTTYSIRNDGDGRGDWGFVFNFNNAKSNGGTEADISETACLPESTLYDFMAGPDGFIGSSTGAKAKFFYANEALDVTLVGRNLSDSFTYERRFFYECGTPSAASFSLTYQVTDWNVVGATNNFNVVLVKPDASQITLVSSTTLTGIVGQTLKTGTIALSDLSQTGTYKIQIKGTLTTANNKNAKVRVLFDNVNLDKTSQYTNYKHSVEFLINAAPYSSLGSGAYRLEVRAKKLDAASDNVAVQVCQDNATPCGSWITRATINNTTNIHATDPDYFYELTTAEYNNGKVRVRYVDTGADPDNTPGGLKIDYHRIRVDQGVCVDFIQPVEADCGKCHNYGGDVTKPWPNTGMHNKHAQTESVADCKWCHPDFTANGSSFNMAHSDGVVTIDGTKIFETGTTPTQGGTGTYNKSTDKTCANSNCHYNLTTPAWNAVYGVNIERNCSRCHNPGAPAADNAANLNIANSWPNTKAHAPHDVAFNMDEYSCQSNGSCHPDNRTQHTVVGDGGGATVKMAPNFNSPTGGTVKYIKAGGALPNDGNGRCYNATCHGGQESPKWDIAIADSGGAIDVATQCTKCHYAETAADWNSSKQFNSAISGLHRGSPPTSGKSHVSEYGCTTCHLSAVDKPAQHFMSGGVTNLDSTAMDRPVASDFVASIGYAVGAGSPPDFNAGTQAPSCSTTPSSTCHAEGNTAYRNPATTWAREWSWRSYSATELDRCEVCHGHWGTFKAGVVEPHVNSNADSTQRTELMTSHSDSGVNCGTMCHGQTDNETVITTAVYNHGVAMTAESKTSDVNANAGFVDNGTTVGCNGCHASNDGVGSNKHAFNDAGWVTRQSLTGPTVACTSCHGGDNATVGNVNYWPGGAGGSYPDRTGEHNVHIQKLAAKLGYPFTSALTDQQQKTMCGFCHVYTTAPGEGGHADNVAPADVGSFNPLWSAITSNYPSTTDSGSSYTPGDGVNGTCASIDCHNNKSTTTAYDWYDGASTACIMCHTDVTTETTHVAHTGASATFGISITCANCHGGSPDWGAPGTAPSTNHINGTFSVSGGTTTFTYTGVYPTKGSCGTNYCHRSDASADTAPAQGTYNWGTAYANCSICHLEAMTSNDHGAHLASNALPGTAVNECYVCHNSTATSGGLATGANHINGADDLNFNGTFANYEASTAARAAGTGSTTTCSNTKCHNGVTTPTWNGTVSCGSCHNTSGTGPLPSAASVIGKHDKHANNDATYTDCAQCHPNAASYTATGGHSDHQNLAMNVTIASAGYTDTTEGGVNYQAGDATHIDDGSCAFTGGCHGNGANVGWATSATLTNGCFACHGGGLSATETGTTKPAVDTIPNPVNNTQYTSAGHGNNTTFPGSGAAGPGYVYTSSPGCYNCHDSSSQHSPAASATDPFRLGATYAANTDNLCLKSGCHDTPAVATHKESLVAMGADWPPATGDYDFKCVDCHDPHGDGNYYMVRSHISAPTASNDTTFGSDSYGTPQDTATISAVTFTSLAGVAAGSFGISGTGNGICEVCHTQTDKYIRGSATADTHNTSGNCTTSCHTHNNSFKAAGGCTSCHGTTATSNVGVITSTKAGSFGATHKHLTGTVTDDQCKVCHNDATQPMNTGSAKRDIIQLKNADTGAVIEITQSQSDTTSTRNVATVTFCTSCHDSNGATSTKFGGNAMQPFGNGVTVVDIASRYNSAITAKTHNYSVNTVPQLTKARSPHGKPGTNDMKQNTEQSTYSDANPVGCQTCHPSHGSATNNAKTAGWSKGGITIGDAMMITGFSDPDTCWSCHNSVTGRVKDYYGDNTVNANWTGTQNSAFAYKRRAYLSAHQVKSSSISGYTTDTATTNVACGICHDPHGAPSWNGTSGSVSYYSFSLRGTWMTSPYLEDRAGQKNGTALATVGSAWSGKGGVENSGGPRATSTAAFNRPATLGHGYDVAGGSGHDGFYLDENTFGNSINTEGSITVNSTTGATNITYMSETSSQFGGLCASCHTDATFSGSGADATARDTNMKGFLKTRNATGWTGGKIHQTVKGWTTAVADITDIVNQTNNPRMHLLNSTFTQGTPWGVASSGSYSPRNAWNWGVKWTTATAKQAYHQFSCSKCHTPHASSQPRLMVSNCLDVGGGTNATQRPSVTSGTTRAAYTYPTIGVTLAGGSYKGGDVATHCHNVSAQNKSSATKKGWNNITGW